MCGNGVWKRHAPHMNIILGSHKIKEPAMEEHLGMCLATEPKQEMEYIKSRIKSSQTVVYAIKSKSIASIPLITLIANNLYQSESIPKITYVVEAMDIGSDVMYEMEAFHYYNANLIQGVSTQAATHGGWYQWDVILYKLWLI